MNWRAIVGIVALGILLWLCGPENVAAIISGTLDWLRRFGAAF